MKPYMDTEDRRLDALWRARFGQPLPILGSAAMVRKLLEEDAAEARVSPERRTLAAPSPSRRVVPRG